MGLGYSGGKYGPTGAPGSVTTTEILDGTIVAADISSSAEILVASLADGTARQLLETAADGTTVSWASNIDVPGTLDVTGAATLDSTLAVAGVATFASTPVISGAAPQLSFVDTSAAAGVDPVAALIFADLTDTGDGTEDADVTLRQLIAGAMTTWLAADADGGITFGTGRALTASGGGSLTGTWTDLGVVTTVDLNGGTIDGATIGGAAPAAGTFLALACASGTTATSLAVTGDAATTGDAVSISADGLTTGTGLLVDSVSTVGGASGASYLARFTSTGGNAQLAHTKYGVYSTVANTNGTSGTNVAGYFSASGATTANYGLIVAAGNVGFGTTAPQSALDLGTSTSGRSLVWGGDGSVWTASIGTTYSSGDLAVLSGLKLNTAADTTLYSYTGTVGASGIKFVLGTGTISFFNEASGAKTAGNTFDVAANTKMTILGSGNVGIGTAAPAAKCHVDQSSATGAVPVLTVDQADVSEEFIRFIGESTTDASQSLVDAANLATPGSVVGWLKIYVEDVQGTGPIADGVYFIPFYTAPTA